MKFYQLDPEEEEILKAFEEGKLVRVKNFARVKKELMTAAKNTLNKTKNINIRLSEKDLYKLKTKAAEEGLPYQTYAASVLHKTVS
ncbi:hypothetical protein HYW46_06920 [Candidatus Daviesbacteria bacterium]|nr:hypothetical protein [Candidatus Daviesbacteria bacterium]